jgi:hypothetical protein
MTVLKYIKEHRMYERNIEIIYCGSGRGSACYNFYRLRVGRCDLVLW